MYIPSYKKDTAEKLRNERLAKINPELAPPPSDKPGHFEYAQEGIELEYIKPSERVERGTYSRYFAKFIPTRELIEISFESYRKTQDRPEYATAYEIFTVLWNSTTPVQDRVVQGYLERGSNYTNFKTLLKILPKYPELFKLVTEDGSFAARIFTEGKGFKTRNGREYIGDIEFTASGHIYGSLREGLYPIDKVITEFDK